MATVSIDVAQLLGEIRQIVNAIKDERRAAKERLKDAQLLVYKALALHPALGYMRPPTGSLGDMDWYTELSSKWSFGIFQKLGQHQHFKRAALLGDAGSRTRIMMLLLWILGNRLTEDQIGRMLSIAVGDGLRTNAAVGGSADPQNLLADELLQLDSVKDVLVDLRRMIKSKLPLPADRNPFLGRDYRAKDEDETLPRSGLWGYELPEDRQYELDIKRNPTVLLRPLPGKLIIPQTKLTLLLIHWATCNFGLGKKAHSKDDVDPNAFWNADPPSNDRNREKKTDDAWAMTELDAPDHAPYAPLEELPIDDWIHIRFCEVYDIHNWIHDSFIRILLLNAFCGALTKQKLRFPDQNDIRSTRGITRWFRRRLPEDICKCILPFVLHSAVALWVANNSHGTWDPERWSVEERGLAAIFTDTFMYTREKDYDGFPFFPKLPTSWFNIQDFFRDPMRSCPDTPDILSLPLLREVASNSNVNLGPALKFRDDVCSCGQCQPIYIHMLHRLEWFRNNYFTITDRAFNERNCEALRISWEPTLQLAEEWFDSILCRIESPYPLFPMHAELCRLGPLVFEVADRMGIKVGAYLTSSGLLRLAMALYTVVPDVSIPYFPPLPMGALGIVVALPLAEDREEYLPVDQELEYAVEYVLFAIGDWLYELTGSDGLTLIYSDDNYSIEHSLDMLRWRTVRMPEFKPDFPGRFPTRHLEDAERIEIGRDDPETDFTDKVEIVLSDRESDGYPLLSLSPETSGSYVRTAGDVAALLRVQCLGRTIESVWRPKVRMGRSCDHTHNHQVMLFCSPTALELVKLMEPSGKCDISASVPITWNLRVKHGPSTARMTFESEWRDVLKRRMDEYAQRAVPVARRGGFLEPNRVCIVRCGLGEGPINAIVVLATSLRKQVYVIHRNECWDCALLRMNEAECTVGLALYTKYITKCDECQG